MAEENTVAEMLGQPDAASQAYLSYLTTLPLQNVLSEPSLLQTQSHHLTSSLTSLTHTSYPTFLELHGTTTALSQSLDALSVSLNTIINDSLPALEEGVSSWRERTESVLGERKKARVVLEQHDKIRDLLEIPILIDTCVRNGFFSEALSLAAHANSLFSSSSSPPLVLTSVNAEVRTSINQMLHSLLATLHEPNRKLPALWKAVNFLRKMEVFNEAQGVAPEEQIALSFITGREACLQSALDGRRHDIERLVSIPQKDLLDKDKEDLTKTFKSYIEAWREGVHDIVTQFSTIFLERSATNPSLPICVLAKLQALIATYASQALHRHLLPVLRMTLPHIPLVSLSPFVNQLTYCAAAFARLGLDFRSVIGDLFASTILTSVTAEMHDATSSLVLQFKQNCGRPTSSQARNVILPSQWAVSPNAIASPPAPGPASKELDVPPRMLTSYPPLAQYTNDLLTTFNSFRQLAPTAIATQLRTALDESLAELGNALMRYLKIVPESESKLARALGMAYWRALMPYVRRALGQGIYGQDVEDVEKESTLGLAEAEWGEWDKTHAEVPEGS
ncbi:Dor1-domain-containing protein [Cylindrobasidium torrendii FP15055 ss-10]|uniref:Conserved oligomeric Golgi complex subunit 8 n=1 Tax=Cylindrobasidium torrendii FP15055 ss-10 TaxID=1314674 RepID=A0A0D7BUQ9_9AGAR|nr:Dor1-domain-containing protein [Cylindrobasidium torrendii FP15055 ss-10]